MTTTVAPSGEAMAYFAKDHANLIDGEWRPAASGRTIDVFDPARGIVIGRAPAGDATDVDLAVRAARRSFEAGSWRGLHPSERARILWRFADLLQANAAELAELETINNGMPLGFSHYIIDFSAALLRYYGGLTDKIDGRNASASVSSMAQPFHAYTAKEPIGVAALIVPWNGPISEFFIKSAPALAAGCSVVIKPAEYTPITSLRLGELAIAAGIPAGVLNVVVGYGHEAGAALVAHPEVDKISFTGSTAIGKLIARTAAETMKRTTMELGGKSPSIIFDDADLDVAIPAAAMGIFANTGQVCIAGSRLFVQRKYFDKVVAGLETTARAMKIGHGLDPSTQLGPVVSAKQYERVLGYIESGQKQGAELVCGGAGGQSDGYFIKPTIFANVDADMTIVREEIFGPVLVATPFDDVDEVVKAANDTPYGLGAGIFSRDVNLIHKLAARLRSGNVWVNCYAVLHPAMPFGGYKESGLGREFGPDGLEAFLETKAITIALQ